MSQAALPPDETARIALLHALNLLDTPADPAFDLITRLAALTLHVPVALVSLVDTERQWLKSSVGVGESARNTPRAISFCAHAILQRDPLIVEDTCSDARFLDNPLVTGEPHVRFYAGMPILTLAGHALGTLCVADFQPRTLTQGEIETLAALTSLVSKEVQQREAALLARSQIDHAKSAIEQSEARFHSVFERASVGIAMVAPDGRLLDFNEAFSNIVGYRRDELIGRTFQDITHPADIEADLHFIERMLAGEIECYEMEKRYLRKDGEPTWVNLSVTKMAAIGGKPDCFVSIVKDIQARKQAEASLAALRQNLEQRVEERTAELRTANEMLSYSMAQQVRFQQALVKREAELSAVIENANDAYVCMDQAGVISAWNQQAGEVFGWSAEEAIGCRLDQLIIPHHLRAAHRAGLTRYLASRESLLLNRRIELPAIRRDGSEVPMEVRIRPLDIDGVTIFSAFLHDISERKQIEQVREREARHDPLTGLPNRRALFEMLPLALARAERNGTALVLFFLDLDGFKQINDTLGHEAGDRVLQEVARRLSEGRRKIDAVARLAGDEFTIVLEGLDPAGRQSVLDIADKLLASLCRPFVIDDRAVQISASIGIAFHVPGVDISADALLKIADTAMYQAKHAGKSRICIQ
jgi:diguanylate cyclase (GGDEF)-like protein/PAS domain S-box-containing protein